MSQASGAVKLPGWSSAALKKHGLHAAQKITVGAHMYLQNAGLLCLCQPGRLHKTLQHRQSYPSRSMPECAANSTSCVTQALGHTNAFMPWEPSTRPYRRPHLGW